MLTQTDRDDILERLSGVFVELATDLAPRIQSLQGSSEQRALEVLTLVERTPGLRADLHGLVARAKGTLTGHLDREEFLRACYELHGLM